MHDTSLENNFEKQAGKGEAGRKLLSSSLLQDSVPQKSAHQTRALLQTKTAPQKRQAVPQYGDVLSLFECSELNFHQALSSLNAQQKASRQSRAERFQLSGGENGTTLVPAADAPTPRTAFEIATGMSFDCVARATNVSKARKDFKVRSWKGKGNGGLRDEDRELLGKLYRKANSLFEFGLGESTYIAAEVGMPRYAGLDSDAAYVQMVRERVPGRFRLYLGDIGHTAAWGHPKLPKLAKNIFDYQAAALSAEPEAFDVYMVDGRFRAACALMALLHASARGGDPAKVRVLIHDYRTRRDKYKIVEKAAFIADSSWNLKASGRPGGKQGELVVLQRREDVSDSFILHLWHMTKHVTH
eukprot:CAMPEP_0196731688 /NCGR_PEP_ID=MMETSP1091-20130531/11305_1 /TAXON_ID=302021 /ORGANISM="Rhodomonas sp., Strain CCMP768" /LENGTH=356 /DNA_ID=CAMNT_0042074839 /DNA_START=76 /DNA_END=1146 /DNA_ORIENTATION=+